MNAQRVPWPMVLILCATATASYICRVNVSTAGALLMSEFSLSQVEMGRIFSIFLLGYSFFQIPAGILADRFGARRLLAAATVLWVLITVLQALVGRGPLHFDTSTTILYAFMVCRLLLGIAESPTYTGAAQGVSKWVPSPFQARANGIVIASVGLGSAIAPVLVSSIMVSQGWRTALLVSAAPAAVMAIIWYFVAEPPRVAHESQNSTSENSTFSRSIFSPSFLLLTVSYTLQGYVGYIFVSWFYLYLVQERHFGLLTGAWMSSLPWVLSIISIPLGGIISDRLSNSAVGKVWGRRLVPIVGMAMSGILIAIGAHTASAVMAGISLAFATAFILCVEGPFWAMMMNLSGPRSGSAGGIMNMGSNLGGLISPALTPLLAQQIGWENALHIAAVLSIIGAVLWIWIKPAER